MTVCKVMPSSTGFYLILLVYFFSLFIEGFHLDPLPEPLGSYMSGKNYNLFIKQEGVCFINAMHFYCSRWQNVFQITSVYTTAKTKNKTKYKKRQTNKTKSASAGTRWPEVTLLSEPSFVYWIAVQKRRFSLNHFKSLKSLQLELVSFCQSGF